MNCHAYKPATCIKRKRAKRSGRTFNVRAFGVSVLVSIPARWKLPTLPALPASASIMYVAAIILPVASVALFQ